MSGVERTVRALAVVVVALGANLVLDVTLDPPVLVRWGLVVALLLLLTALVEGLRRRATARRAGRERASAPGAEPAP